MCKAYNKETESSITEKGGMRPTGCKFDMLGLDLIATLLKG